MMNLPPEEREALKLRMAELKERMEELRSTITSTSLGEWVKLYNEREAIEKRLGDDE